MACPFWAEAVLAVGTTAEGSCPVGDPLERRAYESLGHRGLLWEGPRWSQGVGGMTAGKGNYQTGDAMLGVVRVEFLGSSHLVVLVDSPFEAATKKNI